MIIVSYNGIQTGGSYYHIEAQFVTFLRSQLISRINVLRILEKFMAVGFHGFLYVLSQPGQGNHTFLNS